MKKLILIGIGIFTASMLFSQVFLKTGSGWIEKTVNKGDTVRLAVGAYRGILQWQYSSDGSSWTDYPGQTGERFDFVADEEIYIRLAITSENCDPVFSDVIHLLVAEPNQGTFVDIRDQHEYKWIKIGDQTWMAENLAWLPSVSPSSQNSNTDKFYYVYDYQGTSVTAAKSDANYRKYGVLYNFDAARSACPSGWHLPTDEEWKVLEKYLGMPENEVNSLGWRNSGEVGHKLRSQTGWYGQGNGDNSSGFNALPGGILYVDGHFYDLTGSAGFWSSTEYQTTHACYRYLVYDNRGVHRTNYYRRQGFSVRCLEN